MFCAISPVPHGPIGKSARPAVPPSRVRPPRILNFLCFLLVIDIVYGIRDFFIYNGVFYASVCCLPSRPFIHSRCGLLLYPLWECSWDIPVCFPEGGVFSLGVKFFGGVVSI